MATPTRRKSPAKSTAKAPARSKAAKPNASKEELLHYYREMLLIRRFEEKAGQLY
ncbi:MAG: pyruvate dehydrogenase (acetyl-transferring) E1 component subunit alpha, partial [Pseudomonadota bacterium]